MPKVRWVISYCFVANFICFPVVQKVWKSVKIWQSYREFTGGPFFETQCKFSALLNRLVDNWFDAVGRCGCCNILLECQKDLQKSMMAISSGISEETACRPVMIEVMAWLWMLYYITDCSTQSQQTLARISASADWQERGGTTAPQLRSPLRQAQTTSY